MRIILLGSPGAGKGTQGKLLASHLHIPQISTGDMLRAAIHAETPVGREIKEIMDAGRLVPDKLIIQLVKHRIHEADCVKGYLLDGFPRTVAQADALRQEGVHIDFVLEIAVDEIEVIKRLSGRWIHPASARVYHTIYHPPKVAGKDNLTGEPLVQRVDDHEDTIRQRLSVYHNQTEPLISYYEKLSTDPEQKDPAKYIRVMGEGGVEDVQARILSAIHVNDRVNP